MFDQMKALGAMAGLLRDKDRMREIGEQFEEKLRSMSIEGSAGSGAVRVTVTGKMRVTEVFLDPALVAGLGAGDEGREMAQTLIEEATNDALVRAQTIIHEEARRLAQELGLPEIPGIDKLLGTP